MIETRVRPKHFIHVTDAPIILRKGESLDGQHIVTGGAVYGRVLFTDYPHAIEIRGDNVRVSHCVFESQYCGWGPQ